MLNASGRMSCCTLSSLFFVFNPLPWQRRWCIGPSGPLTSAHLKHRKHSRCSQAVGEVCGWRAKGERNKIAEKNGTVPQIIKARAVLAAASDSAAPNKDLPAPNKEQRQLYFQSTRGIFKAPRLHTLCIMHGRKPSRSEGGEMCNLADGVPHAVPDYSGMR